MNSKEIEDASAMIESSRERPALIRAILTVLWWDGFEQGRRVENAITLRSMAEAKSIIEGGRETGGTTQPMRFFDNLGPVENEL
jgi:hypothetical protein